MYTTLYRTYRPETFEEIWGQEHIVRILKNQIKTGKVGHAYLFCGTRGTGKTSMARILSKALNCPSEAELKPCGICDSCKAIKDGLFVDVIEIDAASNNGVDNIRELRESVKYPPAIGKKKIYIIDEVHMLSPGAFNALLKTLEEPPESVVFILATTEPQKLPATILSRCMRLDFKRVSETVLVEGMRRICKESNSPVEEAALKLIAVNGDGSVRDCLSLLDQCLAGSGDILTRDEVLNLLGSAGEEVFGKLTGLVLEYKAAEAILLVDRMLVEGKEPRQLLKDWLSYYRGLLIAKFVKNPEDMLNKSVENMERMREQSGYIDIETLQTSILELSAAIDRSRWSTQPRILLELCIVKLASSPEMQLEVQSKRPKIQSNDRPAAKPFNPEPDMAALWGKVIDTACTTGQRSFHMIRGNTQLIDIKEGNFTVEAFATVAKDFVGNNKAAIEALMKELTGKERLLICTLNEKDMIQWVEPSDDEGSPEDFDAEVADLFTLKD